MSRLFVVALMLFALPLASCRRSSPAGSQIANQRLHDHIIKNQRKVHVEHLGPEVLWSDSAIFERARQFPPPIQELIDTLPGPSDASIAADAMVQFLQDADRRRAEWRAAPMRRNGKTDFDCAIGDAAAQAVVNCVYVNYLETRYPRAKFLFKAPLEPVLLLDGDQIRGAIMPVKF